MDVTPPLEPGVTVAEQPDRGAIQRLVLETDVEGEALWIDAGGTASTYDLTDLAPNRRAFSGINIARAFTAHQHADLVRHTVTRASGRTGLVVAPNVALLYEATDMGAAEIDPLFERTVTLLGGLAESLSIPVLVTAPRASDALYDRIDELASHEIACTATGLGYAFSTEDFETQGYWHDGWWQTTIPYWVDLVGAVGDLDPVEAVDPGLVVAD